MAGAAHLEEVPDVLEILVVITATTCHFRFTKNMTKRRGKKLSINSDTEKNQNFWSWGPRRRGIK